MLSTMVLTLTLLAAPSGQKVKPATNAICPVLGNKVNPNLKVTVRGQDYFLCCKGCDKDLLANPDTYLQKDGTPKNAPKAPAAHEGHGWHR